MTVAITGAEIAKAITLLLEENATLRRQLDQQKPTNKPKLTPGDVKLIRKMKRDGYKNVEIAAVFDVNRATVSRIIRGLYHK